MLTREEVVKIIYDRSGPIQRFTQDSPVLPDVWIAFAERPQEPHDVLLTPYQSALAFSGDHARTVDRPLTPGSLAQVLKQRLASESRTSRWREWKRDRKESKPDIAYNQSTVAVRLWFDELVRVVLPLSHWWSIRIYRNGGPSPGRSRTARSASKATPGITSTVVALLKDAQSRDNLAESLAKSSSATRTYVAPDVLWSIHVIGTIAFAYDTLVADDAAKRRAAAPTLLTPPDPRKPADRKKYFADVVGAFAKLVAGMSPRPQEPMVYLVSRNRTATPAVWRSAVAVKADAAVRLFNLDCSSLMWAIIDSGIDAWHPAFRRRKDGKVDPAVTSNGDAERPFRSGRSRVVATFDFTEIRTLLSVEASDQQIKNAASSTRKVTARQRKELRESLNSGREIDWALVMPLIERKHDKSYVPPVNEHGTHVAGILGADWEADGRDLNNPLTQSVQGLCPDINLYDLRAFDKDGLGDEFSVMAALQFVRFLNLHRDIMVIHGVNLSFSIPHDVLNYACGRTPVCDECERLVGAGVIVVAAAGNEGYQTPNGSGGVSRGAFQQINITDPGNADSVITVGATHRDSPHTYGVSYFSSRGPTGDGRSKPDIVAPGEKIESTVPGRGLKRMDGTSMAAPHVSGAAALLLARHRELIGRPRRVKEILSKTATDLGREKYFQGAGMVDVLRALQSV